MYSGVGNRYGILDVDLTSWLGKAGLLRCESCLSLASVGAYNYHCISVSPTLTVNRIPHPSADRDQSAHTDAGPTI